MAAEGSHTAALLEQLNTTYEDSLLLVARILGDRRGATRATVTAVDLHGIDVTIWDAEGEHRIRVDYLESVEDATQVTFAALALVGAARAASGEEGQTSAERMVASWSEIRTFVTEVRRVEEVHPRLRRVTFGGGDLATFSPLGPDTFLYLLLPPPTHPDRVVDQSFSWEAVGRLPEDERPVGAYYTVSAWRPDAGEIDVLFVLHDTEPGDGGHASRWAEAARPGDRVALWGPRTSYAPPPNTTDHLLVADETGLPAVGAILDALPDGAPARVFAEVATERERQELPDRAGTAVTWLHRDGAEPGTTSLLVDAVRAADPPGEHTYVWGGAESRAMTAVRRYVRREVGLAREQVSLTGYWRHRDSPGEADED
jgi:NADPH-dependent ferric siderophore reductase